MKNCEHASSNTLADVKTQPQINIALSPSESDALRLLTSRIEVERRRSSPDFVSGSELRRLATGLYRARLHRDQYFKTQRLSDVAWNMLLFAYTFKGRLSVTSLCHSSLSVPTTALRWITRLTEDGLIKRISCTRDFRVTYLHLTEEGCQLIESYLMRLGRRATLICLSNKD